MRGRSGSCGRRWKANEVTPQVGPGVKRFLVSIRKVAEGGNMVIMAANMKAIKGLAKQIEENLVMDARAGVRSEIKKKNGTYVYPMKVRKSKKDQNAMDIGAIGQLEHKKHLKKSRRKRTCAKYSMTPWKGSISNFFEGPVDARKANLRS